MNWHAGHSRCCLAPTGSLGSSFSVRHLHRFSSVSLTVALPHAGACVPLSLRLPSFPIPSFLVCLPAFLLPSAPTVYCPSNHLHFGLWVSIAGKQLAPLLSWLDGGFCFFALCASILPFTCPFTHITTTIFLSSVSTTVDRPRCLSLPVQIFSFVFFFAFIRYVTFWMTFGMTLFASFATFLVFCLIAKLCYMNRLV